MLELPLMLRPSIAGSAARSISLFPLSMGLPKSLCRPSVLLLSPIVPGLSPGSFPLAVCALTLLLRCPGTNPPFLSLLWSRFLGGFLLAGNLPPVFPFPPSLSSLVFPLGERSPPPFAVPPSFLLSLVRTPPPRTFSSCLGRFSSNRFPTLLPFSRRTVPVPRRLPSSRFSCSLVPVFGSFLLLPYLYPFLLPRTPLHSIPLRSTACTAVAIPRA